MKKIFITIFILIISTSAYTQVVYEHISYTNIYDFLDEMANAKIIELNSVIKPYSRKTISEKLMTVKKKYDNGECHLNKRQSKDLVFYIQAYAPEINTNCLSLNEPKLNLNKSNTLLFGSNPLGLFYKDSTFTFAIQPILGMSYKYNENGGVTHTWGGASMFGYIGKNLAFYSNLRDNNESQLLIKPEYFNQLQGVPVKNFGEDGVDYTEARGGLMYSWKWGAVGIVKEHVQWGTGYNGTNIQSARIPSFAQIKLELHPIRWFEFNYYHGWLTSEVVDSVNSYWTNSTYRIVYYQKYIAANMFTIYLFKNFNFSFGNSIVYTNESGGGPIAAYLVPFLFYKSVDLTLSSNDKEGYTGNNNQFFLNISSRNIKHLHLYFSLYADDISTRYFFNEKFYNSFSYKVGFRLSNFYIQNLILTGEYTFTNPYVFQHHAETQNYTSNGYNIGHYLLDNSQELYVSLKFIPIRGLSFEAAYSIAQHGDDYDINDPDAKVHSDPILQNIIWQNQNIHFSSKYEVLSNTYLFLDYNYQNITGEQVAIEKYTPEYYWGRTNTFSFGVNVGF